MPTMSNSKLFMVLSVALLILVAPAAAFGAGNIPSIAQVEGLNFRHGDIEDMLTTLAFLKGRKWSKMMIKRVYFGNWLRDYSQAVDVGSLKGVSAPTIRILVWVLSFLSFGYATEEFEVTEARLGVYRPEEHIDNPKDYADNEDARKYDPRLRPPVQPVELDVDLDTGMKNYIANERGNWATSTGYVKFSLERSIHFGRLYTNGANGTSGKEADLCEALRCLGQGLHCLEDFGAHTNYCELALRELGLHDVFPHTGVQSEVFVHGRRIFPLVTGTFGAVDFLHSVLGEATDHFTQTEVEEMDKALQGAEQHGQGDSQRGLMGSTSDFTSLLDQVPGMGSNLASTARELQAASAEQEQQNRTRASTNPTFDAPPGSEAGPPASTMPGTSIDPVATAKKIYPILLFRDRVVRAISATIAKIPGLESLIEKISEKLTLFILGLLAPFVRPIIQSVSAALKKGSSTVVDASAHAQFEPWNNPTSTNPTHSMLSKDHFSNILNGVAGRVATTILQYVTPRIIYAWENPSVPVVEIMSDIIRTFHHPSLRDESIEIHRNMFNTVRKWMDEQPNRGSLSHMLSSQSVKDGKNHTKTNIDFSGYQEVIGGHGKMRGSLWSEIKTRDMGAISGEDGDYKQNYISTSPMPGTPQAYPSPQFGYQHEPQGQQYGGYSEGLQPGYQPGYQSGYQPQPSTYGSHGAYAEGSNQYQQQGWQQGWQPGAGGYGQSPPMPPNQGYPSGWQGQSPY